MSNTQNNQDIENKASLDKEDEAFVKFDEQALKVKTKHRQWSPENLSQ